MLFSQNIKRNNDIKNPFEIPNNQNNQLTGLDMMGDNLRARLKYCGKGAVIGANTLVNKDVEPWGIYVGSPCKKIGERQKPADEVYDQLMAEFDWNLHF